MKVKKAHGEIVRGHKIPASSNYFWSWHIHGEVEKSGIEIKISKKNKIYASAKSVKKALQTYAKQKNIEIEYIGWAGL